MENSLSFLKSQPFEQKYWTPVQPEVKGSGKIENEIPRKPKTKHSDWLVTCKCFHHAMRGKFEKASVAQKHSAFSRQLSFSLLL